MRMIKTGNLSIISLIIAMSVVVTLLLYSLHDAYASNDKYNYEPYFTANGSNYVNIPDRQELRLQQFSVSAWFRTTINNNDKAAIIVNKGGFGIDGSNVPDMSYGIWIGCNSNKGKVQAGFEDANGRDYFVTSPNTYNDGNWHYVVVTYDGSVLRLYVDGQQVASLNTNNAIPDYNWDKPLVIGKNSLDDSRYFIGDIDEVRVYNRALSAQEVSDAYNNGIFSNDGLITYISMPKLLNNQDYYFDLLDAVKNAKSKIHAHVYQLEYTSDTTKRPRILLDELVNAKKRGVDVRISFSDASLNLSDLKTYLTNNGIPYKIHNSHAKVAVIDDKIVYIGSSNWRLSSLQYNNENNIKTNNIDHINMAKAYIDKIWYEGKTINYTDDNLTGSYYSEVFLTGGYYDSVKNALDNANNQVRLIMKWWSGYTTDPNNKASELTRALANAYKRGVDVKVIIDDTVPQSVRDYLKSQGVPTKLDPSSSQSTHAKSLLVDNRLYIGSHNWNGGESSTWETGIAVINSHILSEYMTYFDNLWNNSNRIVS
jgi:phosphatidylserine/phosphatidylglycerophosphate/cardiolipin synthase-like enzyme